MAYEESLRSITLNADATIGIYTGVPGQPGSPNPHGANQYCFVKITGAHQAGLADATNPIVGVLQNKPQAAGNAATVAIAGVSKVVAAAAVTAGVAIHSDASGHASTSGTGPVVGYSVSATANAGELLDVLITL